MVKDLLSEDSGVSCMRFMCILALFFGFAIAVYGMVRGLDLISVAALSGVFVTPAFAGKVFQKIQEVKP